MTTPMPFTAIRKVQRTRKAQFCPICHGRIYPGSRAVRVTGRPDDYPERFVTQHLHPYCYDEARDEARWQGWMDLLSLVETAANG